MRDILVTSSVLILALLVLRQVFRGTISRWVQYALWGLVLLRLLVPVNLPAMEHKVLTAAEPEYFNEEFFNGGGFNIRDQFLTCLYKSPEEIDLFSLFYNGAGTYENPGEDKRRAVLEAGYGGYYPETDLTKITAADMDAVLTQYTGLTLAQTSQVDPDAFTYLPAYDAYYFFHGDANARGAATFFTGEREGNAIRLYYTDFYFGGYGPCCVALEARPDGSYWFVSHLFSDMPAIPPALPDWKPELTISLEDLAPYEAPGVTVERHTGDVERLLYSAGAYEDTPLPAGPGLRGCLRERPGRRRRV